MHIILGALGLVVTILVLVNRLTENGIDIGWLNPFAWKRRREWAKKYHASPVYSLDSPMEVTGLLMVALAKSEGEISAEQKQEIKRRFREVFHLDEERSAALLTSSSFLLKNGVEEVRDMNKLLKPSLERFSEEQFQSALEQLHHIANFESPADAFQTGIIDAFKNSFRTRFTAAAEWA